MSIWIPKIDERQGPKYRRIAEALADDIAAGVLPPGTRLPPHRPLAYALGVSPQTTSRAYAEAFDRGLIQGEVGRGTFVRSFGGAGRMAGSWAETPPSLYRPITGPIDLSRNLPCPGIAGERLPQTLAQLGAQADLAALTDFQGIAALPHHGQAAAQWLARCGLTADPHAAILTNGAQHALFCTLMAVLQPGDLLLTEALTYAPIKAMAKRLNLHLLPVALDAEGLCPDAFEILCRQSAAKALYLTPTVQTPTTVTLGTERRAAIAAIAERHGVVLIEDDVFRPLITGHPAPIAGLAPDRTVYITSTSKCLGPGLRVGMIHAPAPLAAALRTAIGLTCWMPPPLTAEIAARWILDGTADTLTALQRDHAARRQAAASALLAGQTLRQDAQGLHLWLELPSTWTADRFRAEAATRGVLVVEAAAFAVEAKTALSAVRLCLSHEPDEDRMLRGLGILRSLLEETPGQVPLVL